MMLLTDAFICMNVLQYVDSEALACIDDIQHVLCDFYFFIIYLWHQQWSSHIFKKAYEAL